MQSKPAPPNLSLVGLRFADKTACLGDLAGRAAAELGLDRAHILQALLRREALGSTGLGGGIALPHARLASIIEPFVVFAALREPISFEAVDERPIDVVCLLLLPSEPSKGDLALLSCWARILRDKSKAQAIRRARSIEALAELLTGTTSCTSAMSNAPR